MMCGHRSADGVCVCGNCGTPLPGAEKVNKFEPPPYCRAPYLDLSSWVTGFDIMAMTRREFEKRLTEREAKYRKRLEQVINMEIPDDVRDVVDEEYRCGRQGAEGMCEAVALLRMYAETSDTSYRDRGLALAESSVHLLNRAMRLNWESSNVLLQSLEDMAHQLSGTSNDNAGDYGGSFDLSGGMRIAGL